MNTTHKKIMTEDALYWRKSTFVDSSKSMDECVEMLRSMDTGHWFFEKPTISRDYRYRVEIEGPTPSDDRVYFVVKRSAGASYRRPAMVVGTLRERGQVRVALTSGFKRSDIFFDYALAPIMLFIIYLATGSPGIQVIAFFLILIMVYTGVMIGRQRWANQDILDDMSRRLM